MGHRLGKEGSGALCWDCRAHLGSSVSTQALLSGEVRAGTALSTSMALLFLILVWMPQCFGIRGVGDSTQDASRDSFLMLPSTLRRYTCKQPATACVPCLLLSPGSAA